MRVMDSSGVSDRRVDEWKRPSDRFEGESVLIEPESIYAEKNPDARPDRCMPNMAPRFEKPQKTAACFPLRREAVILDATSHRPGPGHFNGGERYNVSPVFRAGIYQP